MYYLLHFRVVLLICSHLEKNQGEVRLMHWLFDPIIDLLLWLLPEEHFKDAGDPVARRFDFRHLLLADERQKDIFNPRCVMLRFESGEDRQGLGRDGCLLDGFTFGCQPVVEESVAPNKLLLLHVADGWVTRNFE